MSVMSGSDQPPEKSGESGGTKRALDEEQGARKRQRKAAVKAEDEIDLVKSTGGPWPEFSSSLLEGFPGMEEDFTEEIYSTAEDITETFRFWQQDPDMFSRTLGGDKSSRKMVKYYEQAGEQAPVFKAPFKSTAKRSTKKKLKATKKEVTTAPRKSLEQDREYEFPTGQTGGQNTMVGSWPPQITISHPAPKDASYNLQMLNLISQTFLNKIKSVEIESMALVDRVAVSANEADTAASIQKQVVADLIEDTPGSTIAGWAREKQIGLGDIRSTLTGVDSGSKEKLIGMTVGASLYPEQTETLKASLTLIAQDEIKPVGPITPTTAHGYFSRGTYKGRLIVVDAITDSHAEQNLAVALLNSDYPTGKAVAIAGGKRPCTICYLSLCIAREKYTALTFNTKPGGYYIGETKGGLWQVAVAMGLSNDDIAQRGTHYIDDDFTSYMTALTTFEDLTSTERTDLGVTRDTVPRDETVRLPTLEKSGLLTRTPTVSVPPETQFDMGGFGTYTQPDSPGSPSQSSDDSDPEKSGSDKSDSDNEISDDEVQGMKEDAQKPLTEVTEGMDLDTNLDT